MHTSILTPSYFPFSSTIQHIKSRNAKTRKNPLIFQSFQCMQSSETSVSRSLHDKSRNISHYLTTVSLEPLTVAEKVVCIASEFRSLTQPIERVKRLLDYATLLPPFDESEKGEKNRVFGCTSQVWLEAKMVENRLMKFRVDSDSEITKGFCSCLIWLLDGAVAEEVLNVEIDDLFEMNVGLVSRGYSRVNTWHNVLISMQKRTKVLIEERDLNVSVNPVVRDRTSCLHARLVL